MMDKFHDNLGMLQESLEKLQGVLAEEHTQLSMLKINPVSLQMVSDHKSRLLATVAWYDEQRKQQEKQLGTEAPYTQQKTLAARWDTIVEMVRNCNEMNRVSGQLLEKHRQNATHFRTMINKAGGGASLYGATGQSEENATGQAYNISV